MNAPASLEPFCLAHPTAFLIPAEAISAEGVAAGFGRALVAARRLSPPQLARLSLGLARYWQRCAALHARAPQWWFAPRPLNLMVVGEPTEVPPYVVPFAGSSAVLYLSDLGPWEAGSAGPYADTRVDPHVEPHADPGVGPHGEPHVDPRADPRADPHVDLHAEPQAEFIAYLLCHNERLPLVGTLRGSHLANLSYWLMLGADARAAFAAAAARAGRPDAAAFASLASCFGWIDSAWHDPLRPPEHEPSEPYVGLTGTGLFVPKRVQAALLALCGEADRAQADALATHRRPRPRVRPATLNALCDWMRGVRARFDVLGPDGSTVWRAGGPDPSALHATLRDAADAAVASLAVDWAVVHERSVAFLSSLRDPECLPRECALLEQGGSAYVDAARRTIVVPLRASAFDPMQAPAPPYHRLLLGARVMHEWGHLAHKAGIVRVPDDRRAAYRTARERLGEVFAEVLHGVPQALQGAVREELAALASSPQEVPAALARKTLSRIGDYLANLVSARMIPAAEMQAYVRTNVRHHLEEELGLVAELARYAHEVHYLPLAGLPRSYFYETTRFGADFVDTGIVAQAAADALFDAAGAVFTCYSIDESALAVGGSQRTSDSTSLRLQHAAMTA